MKSSATKPEGGKLLKDAALIFDQIPMLAGWRTRNGNEKKSPILEHVGRAS